MDKRKIINEALAIPRISRRVDELLVTKEQLNEAIIILIDIIEENKQEIEPRYITSFNISGLGNLVPTKILSETSKKDTLSERIITQNISRINTNIRIKNIEQTKERIGIALYLKEYKKEFGNNPKGFYLYGEMGIGKSYIAQAMANTLAEKGHTIAFVNIVDLISTIKSKFQTGYDAFLAQLKEVDHLFIDDIGAETVAPWFRDEILMGILSVRMNNNMSTFMTSNYSYDELQRYEARTTGTKYPDKNKSARLMERIKALTNPIKITGRNRRY